MQQSDPQPASGDVWLDVIGDMNQRRQMGIRKYGTPLQAGNGRDALVDAYQEAFMLAQLKFIEVTGSAVLNVSYFY